MTTLYLKNAVAPKSYMLIENERIVAISDKPIEGDFDEVVNLEGFTIMPGLIDMQVHLREPGFEYKETIESGTLAAAKGGFTTIACMPNTSPVIDSREVLMKVMGLIETNAKVEVLVIPAMTKDIKGEVMVDYAPYKDLGVVAITDDGKGVQNDKVMEEVFKQAHTFNLSVLQHCEVNEISNGAAIHEGEYSRRHNIKGIPSSSEWKMVERDINLLRKTGGHYHVLHASCKETIHLVNLAKKEGLHVTVEVTPHHLLLCDEDIPNLDPNFKMNPPLRSKEDREALVQAFINGEIDIVTTDHAPHSDEEKSRSLEDAPFGIIGLETAFPLLYTSFVQTKKMTLESLINVMSLNPQKLFHTPRGELREGALADLVVINTNDERAVTPKEIFSKSHNTPFMNWKLKGWPELTIKSGKIVYRSENL